ncbi:MAG: YebC/PmpR family DNA-binding transcriptional regulator [Deltaproteobacteria bacterium]|nr:YebC/PmpR family DNA-binding transcriptional regulator [Deltaproteobacteria bacterium]
MSGHNKWSTIKHKKAAVDAKRGKVFTKLIKEITVAARMGGSDIDGNPRLRSAVLASRAANMPNDTIDRAVKKGAGELEGVNYEEITYEGYGPEGVAILVDTVTDNTNRTVSEVRMIFNKRGGKMAEPGAVAWMFDTKGQFRVPKEAASFERVFEVAVEAGAEDVEDAGESWLVSTAREDLYAVTTEVEKAGLEVQEAQLAKVPKTTVELTDVDAAGKVMRLIDFLDEHDDVQTVWANFDVTDDVAAQLDSE